MLDKTKNRAVHSSLQDALSRFVDKATPIDDRTAMTMDRELRSIIGRVTRGMSPVAVAMAYIDWLGHLLLSPGKMMLLVQSLIRKCLALGIYNAGTLFGADTRPPVSASEQRMQSDAWQAWPFNVLAVGYEQAGAWVRELTTGIDGVSGRNEELVAFLSAQIVEFLSPANFPLSNPDVIAATWREGGANLARGARNLVDDVSRRLTGELPAGTEQYRVGIDIGVTPGKVVYQNELIELIQYEANSDEVGAEPVLIIPAWIMKYYILDLSPHNSMVRYLRDNGKTVFMISWKNPREEDRDLGMIDYLRLGVMESLDAVGTITSAKKIHTVGYCLGGTLLMMVAALMAREGDDRLKSMTTFASQIDFAEAGEIQMYLGESTFSFLDQMTRKQGYLSIDNTVGAFKSLRATSQIYEPAVDRYLLGNDPSLNDLMAWNADGTRLPHRMNCEYLRNCYLDNNLAEARYVVDGRPICVTDIKVPAFILGTLTDHVAPWKSVFKAHRLMQNEITFMLTTAGHNAGIVSGPSHPRRRHQMSVRMPGDNYTDPDTWLAQTETREGSWWPAWNDWLDRQMSGTREPPPLAAAEAGYEIIRDAPGEYVFG